MKKPFIAGLVLVVGSMFMSVGCDKKKKSDDDDVTVDTPGVDVKVDKLEGAAGSAAQAAESPEE